MPITTTYNRCIACHGSFAAGADGSLSVRAAGNQYDLCPKHGAEYLAIKAERKLTDVPQWARRFAVLEDDETCPHPTLTIRATGKPVPWSFAFDGEFLGGEGLE